VLGAGRGLGGHGTAIHDSGLGIKIPAIRALDLTDPVAAVTKGGSMVAIRILQRSLVIGCGLACGFAPLAARAEGAAAREGAVIGPARGGGQRHVDLPAGTDGGGTAEPSAAGAGDAGASGSVERPTTGSEKPAPGHRRGKAPKEPRATLPEDVSPSAPSLAAREAVALGPVAAVGVEPVADPELSALRQAELVLFPRPVQGLTPGWSWELPAPVAAAGPEVRADGFPPAAPGDKPEATTVDAEWLRSLALPNLPVRFDPRVVRYLEFYRDDPQGRAIARAWVKKAGRYAPAVRASLARAGLPTDLVWLSLIESGHNPTIRSPAGAAGLWQFIPESARLYGLTVDRWVDERLDPRRSTEAAALYLSDLYQRFGSWDLAMAAYNMGHGGLSRAIAKYNTNDFWELSRHEAGIPWETTLYVPKILAIALVMTNPRAFGLEGIVPDEAASFDTVRVTPGVSLSRVAAAAEVSVAVIEEYNPQLVADRVPPATPGVDRFPVALPKGKGAIATRRLAQAQGEDVEPFLVRFGDTLASVAAAGGTTEARVRELNGARADEALEPGTVLLVPRARGERPAPPAEPEVIVVAPARFEYADRRRVFYPVRRGDRLEEIASAFGVEPGEIVLWNELDPAARLQPGMTLQLFAPAGRSLDRVRHLRAEDVRLLVAGTPEFIEHFEGQKGKQRLVITAQPGDTLASVGERFGMSAGSMERINRRSRRDPLEPGEPIVVYAARPAAGAGAAGALPAAP